MTAVQPHNIVDPEHGWHVASVFPASTESVATVLAADVNADGGMARSQWLWCRLADGTLMLGLFPQDGTYFACEVDAETPRELLGAADLGWTPGTIVVPAHADASERIIGVVLETDRRGMVEVSWLSDQRGAFRCLEDSGDLIAAPLAERGEVGSDAIDHDSLADVLAGASTRGSYVNGVAS